MGALDDVFGARDRPTSPDFWKLSAILLKLDGRLDDTPPAAKEAVWQATVAEHVDLKAVTYVAVQRALRAPPAQRESESGWLSLLAAIFLDGFVVGSEFQRDKRPA